MAEFVYRHGGNIIHAEQHTDAERGIFFQRVEFELDKDLTTDTPGEILRRALDAREAKRTRERASEQS